MGLQHALVVTYRLHIPSSRLLKLFGARVHPNEQELYDELRRAVGRDSDDFGYDVASHTRELQWIFRNSRSAGAASRKVSRLRRKFKKANLRTKLVVVRTEALEEGKKRYSITPGQYKRLMREGAARECSECHQCLPKYHGRYPKNCPECGGAVGMPIDEKKEDFKAFRNKKLAKRATAGAVLAAPVPVPGAIPAGAAAGSAYHLAKKWDDEEEWKEKQAKRRKKKMSDSMNEEDERKRRKAQQKHGIKDSLERLVNGRPLDFVIDELLKDNYDEPSLQSVEDVD